MVSDGDDRMIVWWWGGWFGDGNRCMVAWWHGHMAPITTTLCVYRSLSLSLAVSLSLVRLLVYLLACSLVRLSLIHI